MASEVRWAEWPSRMHRIPYGRGQLREYWFLGIKGISGLFKNKRSDHINVALSLLSNLGSTLVLFFLVKNFAGAKIALFISLFYCTSLWPYQVSIYLGHIHLAQFFFLLSLLAVQTAR